MAVVAIQRDDFLERLDRLLDLAAGSAAHIALVLIDISNLSKINHRHSFKLGDAVLAGAHKALLGALTDPENGFRVGPHTFAVILSEVETPGLVVLAASRLRVEVLEAIALDEEFTQAQVCLGIAMNQNAPIGGLNLLGKAEMHLAQTRRGLGIDLDSMQQVQGEAMDAAQLERSFDIALLRNEFEVYYQPQIALHSGEVVGAEALLRWNQSERGFVDPERIIQLAAQSGSSLALAKTIINKVARALAEWSHYSDAFRVAVNVSADLLQTNDLITVLNSATKLWGIEPKSIVIELTEQALVDDFQSDTQALHELMREGYGLSIDDFGTGYSSLAYLKHIPAAELKIDRSFVETRLAAREDRELARIIVELGQLFNMHVVAEGVEDIETRNTLRDLGCDIVQGYFIARPMKMEDFTAWLGEWQGWPAHELRISLSQELLTWR